MFILLHILLLLLLNNFTFGHNNKDISSFSSVKSINNIILDKNKLNNLKKIDFTISDPNQLKRSSEHKDRKNHNRIDSTTAAIKPDDRYLPRLIPIKSGYDNGPGIDTSSKKLNIAISNNITKHVEDSDNYVQEMYDKVYNNIDHKINNLDSKVHNIRQNQKSIDKVSNHLKDLTQIYIEKLHPYELNISKDLHPFVIESCPEIIQYYSLFNLYMNKKKILHVKYQITGLCLIKFLTKLIELKPCKQCTNNKVPMMLWAGSLLGEHMNGRPIPWDDDLDVIIHEEYKINLCSYINKYVNESGLIGCIEYNHDLQDNDKVESKIFFKFSENTFSYYRNEIAHFPYVDIFFYYAKNNFVYELPDRFKFPIEYIFPAVNKFFGGLYLYTPNYTGERLHRFSNKYSTDFCNVGSYSHFNQHKAGNDLHLDCKMMSKYFPFKYTICSDDSIRYEIILYNQTIINYSLFKYSNDRIINDSNTSKLTNIEFLEFYNKLKEQNKLLRCNYTKNHVWI